MYISEHYCVYKGAHSINATLFDYKKVLVKYDFIAYDLLVKMFNLFLLKNTYL